MANFCKNLIFSTKRWPMIISKRYIDEKGAGFDCGPDMSDRGICAVDACEPELCYKKPHVIIVGAGMAGLAAAARLAEKNIDTITVIEANCRPGGRIHSCFLGDVVTELGAAWKPSSCCTHPVYDWVSREKVPRPGVPGCDYPHGLFHAVMNKKTDIQPTVIAYHRFRQIEKEADSLFCLGGRKQHGSMINFYAQRIQQELRNLPESQQHDAARIMLGLAYINLSKSTNDTTMLCADPDGVYLKACGADARVPLGNAAQLAPLLCKIPEGTIKYGKCVDCIYWGTSQKTGHRATVCTIDGDEYHGHYVIVTVSLGVLWCSHIRLFCPALPSSKIDAMRCLGYGYCNKIYLEYCRPFWLSHDGNLDFKFSKSCLSTNCQADWTSGITAIEVVPHSKRVLCAWVVGAPALHMESLCDVDIAECITLLLRNITGNSCIPYPIRIMRSHWCTDPNFMGSFSYCLDCAESDPQLSLASPLPAGTDSVAPILLFAGEATVPGHLATVCGARLSGLREAERIIQLTLRYKGPPIPVSDYSQKVRSHGNN